MWTRKQFDIGWSDLLFGLFVSTLEGQRKRQNTLESIEEIWPEEKPAVFLSVRSGFDCLLRTADWNPNSEVIMSGLTIPDMPRIVEKNGFQPVGVDLCQSNLAPDPKTVTQAITPNTRAIVIAHLFGNRIPLEPYAKIARDHDLILIEDCAQYFRRGYSGNPLADVSMFSFGPIKSCSALGGSVFQIRNQELRDRATRTNSNYRIQNNLKFAKRILKYGVLKMFSKPICVAGIFRLLRVLGRDPDATIASLAHGFSRTNFFDRIRQQPSTALLKLLLIRLLCYDDNSLHRRSEQANHLFNDLKPNVTLMPYTTDSTFWVAPIWTNSIESSKQLVATLQSKGFDATQRSSLAVIQNPGQPPLTNASSLLERMVLLPICKQMRRKDVEKMASIVNEVIHSKNENCSIANAPATPHPRQHQQQPATSHWDSPQPATPTPSQLPSPNR